MLDLAFVLLTTLAPAAGADSLALANRKAELHRLLDQAVMLNRSVSRHVDLQNPVVDPIDESDREMTLELAHLELMGGYLEKACVYEPAEVHGLRFMMTYAEFLHFIGYTDDRVKATLVSRAGKDAVRVEQMLDFAGLNGMRHFICIDYMRDRLREGMAEQDLREYIDDIQLGESAGPEERDETIATSKVEKLH